MPPRGEMMWTRGWGGNDKYSVIEPSRGGRYKVQNRFFTLSTIFYSSFLMVSISLVLTLFYLYTSPISCRKDRVVPQGERVMCTSGGGGKGTIITELLSADMRTRTRSDINSQSHTHTFQEIDKRVGRQKSRQ